MAASPTQTSNTAERLAIIETMLKVILDKVEPIDNLSTKLEVMNAAYTRSCQEQDEIKKKIMGNNGNPGIEKMVLALQNDKETINRRLGYVYTAIGAVGLAALTAIVKIAVDWIFKVP